MYGFSWSDIPFRVIADGGAIPAHSSCGVLQGDFPNVPGWREDVRSGQSTNTDHCRVFHVTRTHEGVARRQTLVWSSVAVSVSVLRGGVAVVLLVGGASVQAAVRKLHQSGGGAEVKGLRQEVVPPPRAAEGVDGASWGGVKEKTVGFLRRSDDDKGRQVCA